MHGNFSGSAVLVNAEVDSMGGVVDSGGGIGVDTSPRRAAIERAQAELRREYDVREERRRELEFLEKGGNPLDFKFGSTASHSVQSTSLADQQAEHFSNSEAKGSFALTTSPHGDSVESSGRPGAPTVCEPNTADNLILFDGENEPFEGGRNSRHPNKRNKIAQSERCSQVKSNQNAKETEDSAIFRPYARRNRSRLNRDPARSNSTDVSQSRGGPGTSLPLRGGSRDGKGSTSETTSQKDRHRASLSYPNSATSNGNMISKTSNNQLNIEVDDRVPAAQETSAATKASPSKNDPHVADGKSSVDVTSGQPDRADQGLSTSSEFLSPEAALKSGQAISSSQLNQMEYSKVDKKSLEDNARDSNLGIDINNEKDLHGLVKVDSNGIAMQKISMVEGMQKLTGGENHTKVVKDGNQSQRSTPELQNDVKLSSDMKILPRNELSVPETDGRVGGVLANEPHAMVGVSALNVSKNTLSGADITSSKHQLVLDGGSALTDTEKEDSILEEARIIQAKRKRITELSFGTIPLEMRQKSHWGFVLEEMAWLANDFAQERLWKMTAASQICHRIAFSSQLRFEDQFQYKKLKKAAFSLSEAVLQFWHSVEVLEEGEEASVGQNDGRNYMVDVGATENEKISMDFNAENPGKSTKPGIQEYARRFLKYNSSSVPCPRAAGPSTPDIMSDSVTMQTSWDDYLSEESLFYSIPAGAMEVYRNSIELHLVKCGKHGSSMQEEVVTSLYDAAAEFGNNDIAYEEDEGETSSYYLPGAFEDSKSLNLNHRKQKKLMKSHSARSYELGADVPYGHYIIGSTHSTLVGKRPAPNLNVGSVPTKRMRTASRQRVASPFGPGTPGGLPVPAKSDASSGDTSSYQDEPSGLHGGSMVQKTMEVESGGDFEKQLSYDYTETSVKRKKKKKAQLGSPYDQAWHLDSTIHNEQRDHWRKRLESHHYDSNGLYGQHSTKKQKTTKQSLDTNFDSNTPVTGSAPSPVASQMSNMSNPNKVIKLIGGRDRGRKTKGLKISPGQQGSGNPWSLLEDQALVVLVHDMGPNWELISDAINSTLKIKCIYRNPIECKERHKNVMDRGAGDGADSAEDSGTSQTYPSTLPGIPKGSARQLFQRLQGPMEEDTLKSHFEKIIIFGKKLHHRKTQNDTRDPKQIVPVHNSQIMALSQVFPNNLNGSVLTPLDLCDVTTSGPDVLSLENSGIHPGIPMLNQAAPTSGLPTSGANLSMPGSSGMALSSTLSSPSVPPSASVRGNNVSRASLPIDEQHRMQQYSQMLSNRKMQQSSLASPGTVSGLERGLGMVTGGNNLGMGGMSRGTPLSRPGFQGMSSSAMSNSGNMLSSGMVGMPNPASLHSGISPGQGNSMLRPRETIHGTRAAQGNSQGISTFNGLSSGFTNQTTPPVQTYTGHLPPQHQISSQQSHLLGNSHHPHLQSPSYTSGAQQQAFAIRQRQMHQRYIQQQQQRQQQQQQQQLAASGPLMPHVQAQSQVPLQNSSQMQPLISSQPLPMPSVTSSSTTTPMAQQNLQRPQLPPHGLGRTSQATGTGPTNQVAKQRQSQMHQQFQQSGRQHPQQRQPTNTQQQNKLLKGMARGNVGLQNHSVDPSHLNGLSVSPGIQAAEKGEPVMPMMQQGQGSQSGISMSPVQPSKPLVPSQSSNHSHPQQKVFPGASPSSQQLHSDNSIQGQVSPVVPGNTLLSAHQSIVSSAVISPNHQHLQPPHVPPHQKRGNQMKPTSQRIFSQNNQGNSELPSKSQTDQTPNDRESGNNPPPATTTNTSANVSQGPVDFVNMRPAISPDITPPQKASGPVYDLAVQNTASKEACSTDPNTAGNDLGPLPGRLPIHGHCFGAQAQKQQEVAQQLSPESPPEKQCQLPEQQLAQSQQHFPQEQQTQVQQMPQIPAAQGNVSTRPPHAKVE